MRRVLNRKFGDLGMFFERDQCGCLVGSWAIEGHKELKSGGGRPADLIAEAVGEQVNDLTISHAKCMRFSPKRWSKRTDEFVTRLIKQRIRKSLGIAPENRPTSLRATSRETAGVGECRFGRGA